MARTQPDDKTGRKARLVNELGMYFSRHILCQCGRNATGMDSEAFHAVFAVIEIDELAQAVNRMLGGLIVRSTRGEQLRADRGDQDEISA
jgi:hypothetical protein